MFMRLLFMPATPAAVLWTVVLAMFALSVLSVVTRTFSNSIAGLPGISGIPDLGLLTSQSIRENDSSDLLIFVTPHLVRMGANQTQESRVIASPDHMVPVVR